MSDERLITILAMTADELAHDNDSLDYLIAHYRAAATAHAAVQEKKKPKKVDIEEIVL